MSVLPYYMLDHIAYAVPVFQFSKKAFEELSPCKTCQILLVGNLMVCEHELSSVCEDRGADLYEVHLAVHLVFFFSGS